MTLLWELLKTIADLNFLNITLLMVISICFPRFHQDKLHYWWHKSEANGWVMVVTWHDSGVPRRRLSRSVRPLPPSALFHRLDLLSPSEARVCRHFNQMATLGE